MTVNWRQVAQDRGQWSTATTDAHILGQWSYRKEEVRGNNHALTEFVLGKKFSVSPCEKVWCKKCSMRSGGGGEGGRVGLKKNQEMFPRNQFLPYKEHGRVLQRATCHFSLEN
jgi:hypothetical protein